VGEIKDRISLVSRLCLDTESWRLCGANADKGMRNEAIPGIPCKPAMHGIGLPKEQQCSANRFGRQSRQDGVPRRSLGTRRLLSWRDVTSRRDLSIGFPL
jgi:hypothetical protein